MVVHSGLSAFKNKMYAQFMYSYYFVACWLLVVARSAFEYISYAIAKLSKANITFLALAFFLHCCWLCVTLFGWSVRTEVQFLHNV